MRLTLVLNMAVNLVTVARVVELERTIVYVHNFDASKNLDGCSFKEFGYSVKLKGECSILNQLHDSVKSSTGGCKIHYER
ncbi:hypothetical protein DE146DRAFT_227978 [Phaeosphaeria sp. MPI-PUGE-AT-0046c]|nr:hypothetical protein DE146DRAFT_227978 [Phaeosphaeria sp. MPI-PUGE-AT-0046c]